MSAQPIANTLQHLIHAQSSPKSTHHDTRTLLHDVLWLSLMQAQCPVVRQ